MQGFSRLAVVSSCALLALGGCATNFPSDRLDSMGRPAATSVDVGVDWAWSIAGDAAVRPLQVFSLQGKTYLQMRPGQILPAILSDGELVPFTIKAPYIIVQDTPDHMDVVASGYRAVITHAKRQTMPRGNFNPQGPAMPEPGGSRIQRVSPEDAERIEASKAEAAEASFAQPVRTASAAPETSDRAWPVEASKARLSRVLQAWGQRERIAVRWAAPVDVPVVATGNVRASNVYVAVAKALSAASNKGWTFTMGVESDGSISVSGFQQGSHSA